MASATIRLAAIRAGLMALWIPIIWGAPYLVLAAHGLMPGRVQNLLFFWPQAAFPLHTFHGAPPNVGARVWPGWWVLYWVAVMAGFAITTRRLRPLWTFTLAPVVIVVFMMLLHVAIDASGLYFELDVL